MLYTNKNNFIFRNNKKIFILLLFILFILILFYLNYKTYLSLFNFTIILSIIAIYAVLTTFRSANKLSELKFFRTIIDNMNAPVIVCNSDGNIIFINNYFRKMTGYSLSEIKDKPYWSIFTHEEQVEEEIAAFNNFKTGNNDQNFENYWIMKDGSSKLISWTKTLIPDNNKNSAYIVAAGKDVSERANTETENMVNTIAHDIKSPILSVQLFSNQIIKKWQKLDDMKKIEYLNIIYKEGERLKTLIDEILESLLMLKGYRSLDFKSINPCEFINHIYDIYKMKAEGKGIKLNLNCTFSEEFTGDSQRLYKVLSNLLDNALKFSDKGDVVNFNASKSENSLLIEIKDNGIGIKEEDITDIFKPFNKSKKSRVKNGYGLNLAYAKSVIEKHNGTIKVNSKPGEGTTFIIQLPAAKENTTSADINSE